MLNLFILITVGVLLLTLLPLREPRQPHLISEDWPAVRVQATIVAYERMYDFEAERAARISRYIAKYPCAKKAHRN